MSRLRDAAAAFVEHGRWLGVHAARRTTVDNLKLLIERTPHAEVVTTIFEDCKRLRAQCEASLVTVEASADRARAQAEALMAELEHPGARVARRLVTAWRGARAAWRGSR